MAMSVPFLLILGEDLSLRMVANDSGVDEAAQIELLRSKSRHGGWRGENEVDVVASFKLHSSQPLRSAERSTGWRAWRRYGGLQQHQAKSRLVFSNAAMSLTKLLLVLV